MNIIRKIKFELDEIEYSAKVELDVWEENYGEDADGNRGVMTTMSEVENVTVYGPTGKEIKETPEMTDLIDAEIDKIDLSNWKYEDDDEEEVDDVD